MKSKYMYMYIVFWLGLINIVYLTLVSSISIPDEDHLKGL